VTFSHDGTRIVGGDGSMQRPPLPPDFDAGLIDANGRIQVWDASTGNEVLVVEEQQAKCVAISDNGTRIASGSYDGTVKVWEMPSGKELFSVKGDSNIWSVAFNRDGTQIISGTSSGTVYIWDAAHGHVLRTIGKRGTAIYADFGNNDVRIVRFGSHSLTLWNATDEHELFALGGHRDFVECVAFDSSGARIVTGSSDRTVRVWDAASGQELLTLKAHDTPVESVAISRDGTKIASGSYGTIKIWDGAPRKRPIE